LIAIFILVHHEVHDLTLLHYVRVLEQPTLNGADFFYFGFETRAVGGEGGLGLDESFDDQSQIGFVDDDIGIDHVFNAFSLKAREVDAAYLDLTGS
jgi:hypothetical protein